MTTPSPNDPALSLFPYYEQLVPWYEAELEGLSDQQLDYAEAGRWWSAWSIRRQVSHVCYAHFFWSGIHWGRKLWPDRPVDVKAHLERTYDRVLREDRWWEIDDLKAKLRDCVGLSLDLLRSVTALEAQTHEMVMKIPAGSTVGLHDPEDVQEFWERYQAYHTRGIRRDPDDPETWRCTLEMIMRHILWEGATHLFAIQLLKKALGLSTVVEVPAEGYVADDMKKKV